VFIQDYIGVAGNIWSLANGLPSSNVSSGFENLNLESREDIVDTPSLVLLLLCIMITIMTKFRNSRSFEITLSLFLKRSNFESTIKESWPLFSRNSWLLVINFVLNLALSIYLLHFSKMEVMPWSALVQSLLISTSFFVLAFGSMTFIYFLSGSQRITQIPMQVSWVLPQFTGLALLCMNLACLLNRGWENEIMILIGILLLFMSFQRLYRSVIFLQNERVEWYYFLLYLCTLEIVPFLLLVMIFFN
jgi:hypothetical protein